MEEKNRTIKILSVDDEPDMQDLISQKFRREIRNKVYEFVFAQNGAEALDRLEENPDIDFILSDINMPVMDGLTLLSRLQALPNKMLKTIMVTAYGDMDNIRTAMNNGAFDFINKPINFEDLEITMKKTIQAVEEGRRFLHQRDQLITIQKDLEVAKNIQLSLVPHTFLPTAERQSVQLYATIDAAKVVGGDLYDFFWIDDNKLGIVIGDVSGKGIPGAIFMALSRTIIRTTALKDIDPDTCMAEANDLIANESIDSMFVTVFYGVLDTNTGEFTYTNAGHCPPYILRNNGSVEKMKKTSDIVLGIMPEMPYHKSKITLEKGESVFLYSDGVTEAMNIKDELFSERRLEETLSGNNSLSCEEICRNVIKNVQEFAGEAEQSDDITTLCFRRVV